jgi:LPS export ABC transporter protein LptC
MSIEYRFYRRCKLTPIAIVAIAMVGMGGCYNRNKTTNQPTPTPSKIEASLALKDLSLSQVDKSGNPAWKVTADSGVYTPDRKKAQVTNLQGELYQDGKIAMRLAARSGEVEQDGERVILRGDVVASETRNSLVLSGQEVVWQPKQNLLTIRDRVIANHPRLQVNAREGTYNTRSERAVLIGKIQAVAKEPTLQMQTERLTWLVKSDLVSTESPLQVQQIGRLGAKERQIVANVTADRGTANLDRRELNLTGNVKVNQIDPPTMATGSAVTWYWPRQIITTDRPLQIVHQQEGITLNADRGNVNLGTKIATLSGRTSGIATRNQASLKADQLVWEMDTQKLVATGNVNYRQTKPDIKFSGSRGIGKLQDQSIVVSGGAAGVKTEIVPEQIQGN